MKKIIVCLALVALAGGLILPALNASTGSVVFRPYG